MGLIWIRKDDTRKALLDTSNQHIYTTYREVKKRKGKPNTFRVEGYASARRSIRPRKSSGRTWAMLRPPVSALCKARMARPGQTGMGNKPEPRATLASD